MITANMDLGQTQGVLTCLPSRTGQVLQAFSLAVVLQLKPLAVVPQVKALADVFQVYV